MSAKTMKSININNVAVDEKLGEDFRLVAPDAETALVEHSRQAVKVADGYIHDNRWNWQ